MHIDMSYVKMRNELMVNYALMIIDQTGIPLEDVGGWAAYCVAASVAMAAGNAEMIMMFDVDDKKRQKSFFSSWMDVRQEHLGSVRNK